MRTHRQIAASALFVVVVALGCRVGSTVPAGAATVQAPQTAASQPVQLPNKDGSLKFAVLGDFGTGDRPQYEMANQMAVVWERFKYKFIVLVGDNLYGSQRPQDFVSKFERPYEALLDKDVKFYASLGNHDAREQRYYKLFNMDGKLYYSFKAPDEDVRFFALESTYMERDQVAWIEKELQNSNEKWKIAYFHHPLYSSGGRHGSDRRLREVLEPLFIKYNISVVFSGHDHIYERLKPQNGITYFVVGSGGQLRRGNINDNSGLTARGFDTDLAFMVAEISDDEMYFNAISRAGNVVDSGIITRRQQP
ncbi:MAG: metallophosphoesterase [Acidobacteria bacterium]|nr:metallophosphoesterase [Acidobacteriota bacterium]MCA1651300.1 metallophosphoesterase [Acidobacteriota bacterium]